MSNLMLGNGDRSGDVEQLEVENAELQDRIRELELELSRTKRENARAIGALRQILAPLRGAILTIFGEMDAIGGAEQPAPSGQAGDPRKAQVWESWKQKLGGQKAKCIDAFLTHGALTQTQLRVIVGCATSSVPGLISDLRQVGLIEKNGNKFQLKEL